MRNTRIRGLTINRPRLKILEPIFKNWIKIVNYYCSTFPGKKGDAPYWYDEVTTMSTLAGAIWIAGGVALQELDMKKYATRGRGQGVIDLMFYWQKEIYAVEAKQMPIHIDKQNIGSVLITKVNIKIEEAMFDLARKKIPIENKVALVFILPSMFPEDKHNMSNFLHAFCNKLCTEKYEIITWVFPKSARELKYYKLYPGVALVVRLASK